MPDTTGLAEIARMIAAQTERLDRVRGVLRDHPEQVSDVLDPLIGMLDSLDRVIAAAGAALHEHGSTAVTTFGDRSRGSARAIRAGGLLSAASAQVQSLRTTVMDAAAESVLLVWPEHDPLAAEELGNYRRFLEQRERQLDPDPESSQAAPEQPSRDPIDRS